LTKKHGSLRVDGVKKNKKYLKKFGEKLNHPIFAARFKKAYSSLKKKKLQVKINKFLK